MEEYEKRVYTLKEIAKILGKPRTTVDSWRDLFEEYLPVVGEGRNRRYKREAVNIFETIARMKEAHETNEEIRRYLGQMVKDITVPEESHEPPPLLRQLYDSYTYLLEQNERLEERLTSFQEESRQREELLLQKIEELSNKLEAPAEEERSNDDEPTEPAAEESVSAEKEEPSPGFLRRFFRKKR